ncbi:MAG: DUF4214 domain-containing protein [Pyrinomonadaceae bacterium]
MRKLSIALLTLLLAYGISLAQPTAPTLRIVTEDPNLPSELFYGDIKVKPLRLRPGTNTPITINDHDFFVQQQYIDFLDRQPEAGGFAAWKKVLDDCQNAFAHHSEVQFAQCDRIAVSASFFLSDEFRAKGYFVYRYYRATLDRLPKYAEIKPDMRAVTGLTGDERIAKQNAFADAWVTRSEFAQKYPASLGTADLVNQLEATSKVTLANKAQFLIDNAGKTQAQIVRAFVESHEVTARFYNEAFVAMQYFGYLRRDPDADGFAAWLRVLDANPADARVMIWGFIYSTEYTKNRF